MRWKSQTLLVPVLLCGCATGFDRAALEERLNDGTLQMKDCDIAEARATRAQLRLPCRIAVYLKPSNCTTWRWSAEDKAVLEPLAAALRREGIATEVFPLPDMLTGKGDMKEVRVAAARCGADVLLVIHGAAQTDSYKNVAAALDLTVVGGFIVPGSHKDSLFMIEGCLLDVDNEFVYTGAQAEGVGKIIRPTFVIDEKDAIVLAKKKALEQFGDEFLHRMRNLAARTPTATGVPAPADLTPTTGKAGGRS